MQGGLNLAYTTDDDTATLAGGGASVPAGMDLPAMAAAIDYVMESISSDDTESSESESTLADRAIGKLTAPR